MIKITDREPDAWVARWRSDFTGIWYIQGFGVTREDAVANFARAPHDLTTKILPVYFGSPPPVELPGCDICGGRQVKVRPRYPGGDQRVVCPTCLADRLDHIREISDPQTYQAKTVK